MIRPTNVLRRRQHGSYLVLAAFVIIVLMMTAALAVDISRKYQLEQKCQDIADASAMAGAAVLPNVPYARNTCTTYIKQAGAAWYIPRDSDVLISVSADCRSGTVGVLVRGSWDPLIMPDWLVGSVIPNTVTRYSIAIMSLETKALGGSALTVGASAAGRYALFVGDTNPALEVRWNGNNIDVTGGVHINHKAYFNGNNEDIVGGLECIGITGAAGHLTADAINSNAPIIDMPQLDESKFRMDVVLDINLPGANGVYGGGGEVNLRTAGADGTYGTADDVTILNDGGNPVKVKYAGMSNGHQQWQINPANKDISSTNNPTLGAGVDIKVVGDVIWNDNNNGLTGFLWTTGSCLINPNNAEFHSTTDNFGMCMYTGPPGNNVNDLSLNLNGNFSQQSFTGLIYVNGNCRINGNASNNTQAIVGGLWAKRIDVSWSADLNGNNWGILGDINLIKDVPLIGTAAGAPQYSTPTVWLKS